LLLKEPYFSDAVTPEGLTTRKEIQLGAYKTMPNHVKTPTGAIHYYASPEETPIKMGELVEWFNEVSSSTEVHPVVIASLFHHQFTAIHPFDDGNGRMARLLMNLILMQNGYPPIVIKQQDRNNYYQVLRRADAGEYEPLIEYNNELLLYALNVYLRGAKGDNIDEIDDVDKEIALFKLTLRNEKPAKKINPELVKGLLYNSILPLFQRTVDKLNKELSDLFLNHKIRLILDSNLNREQWVVIKENIAVDFGPAFDVMELIGEELRGISLQIDYNEFRKVKEPFNIRFFMKVVFDDYKYRLNVDQPERMQIAKAYDEDLGQAEIQSLVMDSLKSIFKDVKERAVNSGRTL
jgi:hypothetical protein